jgi:hypothetical protein
MCAAQRLLQPAAERQHHARARLGAARALACMRADLDATACWGAVFVSDDAARLHIGKDAPVS